MRLIDADALKQKLIELYESDPYPENNYMDGWTFIDFSREALRPMIDEEPTIAAETNSCEYWDSESHFCTIRRPQAELIKRGKPVVYYHGENTFSYECSVCRMPIDGKDYYCRWCGAKIVGGKEND